MLTTTFKKVLYFCILAFRKLLPAKPDKEAKIVLYPAFGSASDLNDIIHRLDFYLPERDRFKIHFMVDCPSLFTDAEKIEFEKRGYLLTTLESISGESVLLLVHKWRAIFSLRYLAKISSSYIIDKLFYWGVESLTLRDLFYNLISEKEKRRLGSKSLENFRRLSDKVAHLDESVLFLTGPSFEQYKNFEFKDQIKVVCNSIVKDEEFLDFIGGPDILTFADPVFHFSPNKYSSEFRKDVRRLIRKYETYIFVPESTVPLLLSHIPEAEKYLIGVNCTKKIVFPSVSSGVASKATGNILTFLMLPIASSFSKSVHIIGADGRGKSEKYFWRHNPKSQYGDKMNSVFEYHPSFFRDYDYSDYYRKHCKLLEKMIVYGERLGIKYLSLTKSHIPALKSREAGRIDSRSELSYE